MLPGKIVGENLDISWAIMMDKYPQSGGTQMLKQKRQEINVALRVVPDTEIICGCRGIISFLKNSYCLLKQ